MRPSLVTYPPFLESEVTTTRPQPPPTVIDQFVQQREGPVRHNAHNIGSTHHISLSSVTLPRVVASRQPSSSSDGIDNLVGLTPVLQTTLFRGVPTFVTSNSGTPSRSAVSRIINKNGRIHLVSAESGSSFGDLTIQYQLPASLSPTARITPVIKPSGQLRPRSPRNFFF